MISLCSKVKGKEYGYDSSYEIDVASSFSEMFKTAHCKLWLCENDQEEIVGSIGLVQRAPDDDRAEIMWFVLEKAYRGKGIERDLLQEINMYAREIGVKRVVVCCPKGWEGELFESMGFCLMEERLGKGIGEQTFELNLSLS